MKRCKTCHNTYPLDLFERFEDSCIGCCKDRVPDLPPKPARDEPEEWQSLNTISKVNDRFLRVARERRS